MIIGGGHIVIFPSKKHIGEIGFLVKNDALPK